MRDLAATLWKAGHLKQAQDLEEKVLNAHKEAFGEGHSETIRAMQDLAVTLHSAGQLKQARDLKEKVLNARKEAFGESHPETIQAMGDLAATLWKAGHLKLAQELEEKVLNARKEVLDPTMSSVLSTDARYPHIHAAKLNAHWSSSEKLFDRLSGNFLQFSTKLEIFLQQCGLDHYIFSCKTSPLIVAPDATTKPHTYNNWLANNGLIIGVIRTAIDHSKHNGLVTDKTAKDCYKSLKSLTLDKGPVVQCALLREALSTFSDPSSPLKPIDKPTPCAGT
ncbi:hypothetical protein H0H92_006408 [Tricholoma furcatifolium]|nr:hypothetical protein H0H92_006408 [Tricholoma furcatifolium]